MEACGMQGFRFHDLRHTFRTLGAEAGVPVEVMMAQLGHMDRETSLEYVHIQQRALERAKQLIESEQEDLLATAEGRSIEPPTRSEASRRRARLESRTELRRSRRFYRQPRRAAFAAMSAVRTVRHELPVSTFQATGMSTDTNQNPEPQHLVPASSATARSGRNNA
jgi:hypothetical protein